MERIQIDALSWYLKKEKARIHSDLSAMSVWWVRDQSGHKRGPCEISHIALLMHLGSITADSFAISDYDESWKPLKTYESINTGLANLLNESKETSEMRLPLSEVPNVETCLCEDPSCPLYPGCDLAYIWDRKDRLWLTFNEYVTVCKEDGLLTGIPERTLPESADQVEILLRHVDEARGNNLGKQPQESDDYSSDPEKEAKRLKRKAYRERKRLRREAGLWVKSNENPNVYVSGLSGEITTDDILTLFKQAGDLKVDLKTGEPRIKFYGNGDCLVTYARSESVKVAIDLFHEYELKHGCVISVQQADFDSKESIALDQSRLSLDELREKAQLNREGRRRLLEFYKKERALKSAWDIADYQATGNRRNLRIVVFQNCFDPRGNDVDYAFIREQMSQLCRRFGDIKKVVVIKDSLDGFVCVRFDSIDSAERCVASVDAALETPEQFRFMNRVVTAFFHDGRDLYARTFSREAEAEENEKSPESQDMEWEEFLYEGESSDDSDIQIRTE